MGYCIGIFTVAAALLADLLLGNYGFTPCLTVFALFHASLCTTLRFGVVSALVAGLAVDLLYCRETAWTPVLFAAVLLAGRAALFSRDDEASRSVIDMLLSGAIMGVLLTLGESIPATHATGGLADAVCRLLSGIFSGALAAVLVAMLSDGLCRFLGAPGIFRTAGAGRDFNSDGRKRRVRRVRAANMVRRDR